LINSILVEAALEIVVNAFSLVLPVSNELVAKSVIPTETLAAYWALHVAETIVLKNLTPPTVAAEPVEVMMSVIVLPFKSSPTIVTVLLLSPVPVVVTDNLRAVSELDVEKKVLANVNAPVGLAATAINVVEAGSNTPDTMLPSTVVAVMSEDILLTPYAKF